VKTFSSRSFSPGKSWLCPVFSSAFQRREEELSQDEEGAKSRVLPIPCRAYSWYYAAPALSRLSFPGFGLRLGKKPDSRWVGFIPVSSLVLILLSSLLMP